MTFRPGQQVECIDDSSRFRSPILLEAHNARLLIKGHRYTVRSVEGNGDVHLIEIVRPMGTPYCAGRFPPLVERQTDIGIFTRMLNPQHSKAGLVA